MRNKAAVTVPETKRALVDGTVVELWENPDVAFRCDARALAGYVEEGEWDLVFNGIMLNVDHGSGPEQGIFKAPLSRHPT